MIDFTALPDTRRADAAQLRYRLLHIGVVSACGLFAELILIRWLDAQVRPLAYVKNLPLIASFLGLGIGYATPFRKRSTVPFAVLMLAVVFLSAVALSTGATGVVQAGPAGPESNLGTAASESGIAVMRFFAIVGYVFTITALAMIPLGQLAAELMTGIETLRAYTANLIGSLVGVLAAFALSAFAMPPWVDVVVVLLIITSYIRRPRGLFAASIIATFIAVAAMYALDHRSGQMTVWSPYNKIELQPLPHFRMADGREYVPGYQLSVQHLYYQRILDLSRAAVARFPDLPGIRALQQAYEYPYYWKKPENVLILGAGTGNDVAAALRRGASHVDAVDIDRRILDLGRRYHPERPYDSPDVTLINDDGRAYLSRSTKTYDMIVYGILDAHTSFYSTLAGGIRLDNYIYTTEAFRQAVAHLTPDGLLVISFYYEHPWLVTRLASMLEHASGQQPFTLKLRPTLYSFVVGPGRPASPRFGAAVGAPADLVQSAPAHGDATDDWPFLYLRDRVVPPTILLAAAGVLLITIALVYVFFRRGIAFDRHFFFLGAGFLLIETRTIAQLALLFGTTWRVSAIAIAAILTLAIIANAIVERFGALPRASIYILLFLALAANYGIPLSVALGRGLGGRIAMTLLLALPVAFSSLIFASSASEQRELAPVLASNLTGAVVGGLLENLSLVAGISALSLIAIGVYLLSLRVSAIRKTQIMPLPSSGAATG